MFEAVNIASTGLTAQRLKMDVISNNIANASTTRTNEGDGPYRKRRVVMQPVNTRTRWKSPVYPFGLRAGDGEGVRVLKIERDETSPVRLVFDPSHPDAVKVGPKKGYVEYPNVDIVSEMVDMIAASRSYEANSQVIQGAKSMFQSALQIGRA
ncbi:flagellar basal body rod protein FlgC [Turneriella parva]|jgi:flagellar basal-body rod protein FlgC|uniref:Flagellar basal-body rod protein FlgC n=1 Tax=Turneriella parva (strain ATCC BAA-1111 / DSM 21527 / NCTC 11395 / H) TaxID=869212 RepID=I4BBK9_TURPD|nr:flagellar basal body rod protein FlgC [Turneriella parva]AFM14666.1 flagellar basal-body rod protein FlgC [Turneriella parva DSM 21527]